MKEDLNIKFALLGAILMNYALFLVSSLMLFFL